MKTYIPRLVERAIEKKMDLVGAVVVQGPKWCGKSTTAKRFAKTIVELQDEKTFTNYSAMVSTFSDELFGGERPILFDEWQTIPKLWNCIRHEVDKCDENGQFILTGSATPTEDKKRHSGLGRITRVTMRPLSLFESGESTGEISLGALFTDTAKIKGNAGLNLEKLIKTVCRGGWPRAVTVTDDKGIDLAELYFNDLIEHDITAVDSIKRNPERARKILRSYARNISSQASNRTIKDDSTAADTSLDEKTFASYTNAFRKLFVIEDIEAWSPELRSKTVIRSTPKRQFVDPSIAVVALNATPEMLKGDLKTFGFLFESLCIRDLRVYAESIGGKVLHYRDASGLEADAIVRMKNDEWGAFEIKLGANQIDEAAANLIALRNKIDTKYVKAPKFLAVLTGFDCAYTRPDGVHVIPIGCLRD